MVEQRPLFMLESNIFCPSASLSAFLHRICDTTSSPLTVLSMEVMAGGDSNAAATDLVALVDAVDELRVGGCPRKTDRRRVDRLGLHVPGGDGGNWDGWGEEEKGQQGKSEKTGEAQKNKGVRTLLSRLLEVCLHLFWCQYWSLLHRSEQILPSLSFWWHLDLIPRLSVGLFVTVWAAYGFEGDVTPLCGPYKEDLMLMQLNISQHGLLVDDFNRRQK